MNAIPSVPRAQARPTHNPIAVWSFVTVVALALMSMSVRKTVAQSVEGPLERQHVREYIRLRIETHQLQQKMKANAEQYDRVIQAFFERRAEMLKENGWTPEAFDALEKRIMRTETALEMVSDSAERRTERREQLKTIEASTHLSAQEKEELRTQMVRQDSIRQARHIDPTRRDWAAVRPYLDALEHLVDYVALNRPDPPKMDEIPPANK